MVLLEEGFGLKVGNFVEQRRLQRATCDLLSMHDSHTATLSQLDEVRGRAVLYQPCSFDRGA